MREQSIFGETLCGQPITSAGARTHKGAPCHGLFGTKLFPEDEADEARRPGIRPDELPASLS